MSRLWQWLSSLDRDLFLHINNVWTNAFFDKLLPIWRDSITWLPLYLFLFLFAAMNLGKRAWVWIVFLIVTVALCDQISSTFVKSWVNRLRPCRDVSLQPYMRLLAVYCPGSGSFTSSHAVNHFGAATFIAVTLKPLIEKWRFLFYAWAATICYAQVYVGVHYPLDVIGGGLLGALIGYLLSKAYLKNFAAPELSKTVQHTVD